MPAPILRGTQAVLAALKRERAKEFAETFERSRYNQLRSKKPLTLNDPDQHLSPNLNAHETKIYSVFDKGRKRTSRETRFIAAPALVYNTRYPRWHDKVHLETSREIPNEILPITLEKRGKILAVKQARQARYIHEGNRKRRDTKARRYIQLLRFVNRTYGSYTEAAEVAEAFQVSNNLSEFVQALALSEAVDRLYGARANLIKQQVYRRSWYKLPVGLDAIRTLWRRLRS